MFHQKIFPFLICSLILTSAGAASRTAPAKRIISLTPATTEIICRLGAADRLAGRSSACNFPAAIKKLPVAGDMATPYPEKIFLIAPDTIICDSEHPDANFKLFRQHGINVCKLPGSKLSDYPDNVRTIGRLLQMEAAAEAEVRRFEKCLSAARNAGKRRTSPPPKVLLVLGLNPVITCGRNTFVSDLIEAAGGRNIAAGRAGYFPLSAEFIAAAAPEIIIAADMPGIDRQLSAIPGWQQLPAVRSNRIHTDLKADLLFRLGPRITTGLEILQQIFQK